MKDCNQCGKCCIRYGANSLSASDQDLEWWENNRPHIFNFVKDKEIWIDPETNEPMSVCPWLRKEPNQEKYTCDIYFDRPEDCRFYPTRIDEMIQDECEMIEPRDLINAKKAQKDLDIIMSDSRPPAR
ncbi:MAG: Fe-S-cluster containining protein [Candidatus Azotimanducaceae bacterium]|jgi:Fe-S-cluster containining protein